MRLVTWNVNSIKARYERVDELLANVEPDILFLQETKVDAAHFPHLELGARGYAAADLSGGRWCGVAVVAPSAVPITDVVLGLEGEREPDQARWIEATVGGVRCVSTYVPNGQTVGSEPFESKLIFYAAAKRRIAELASQGPLVLAGDMNVAPTDLDVWDPAAFVGSTHVTPVERRAHAALLEAGGLVDAYRAGASRRGPGGAHLVGLPGRRVPQAPGAADRQRAALRRPRRAGHGRPGRPPVPQGREAVRPRAGRDRSRCGPVTPYTAAQVITA